MNQDKILKEWKSLIELYINGREFYVRELFDPFVWESFSFDNKLKMATLFKDSLNYFNGLVKIKEVSQDLIKQKYVKIGINNIHKTENIFPDKPVTIKRNERGNA